MSLRKSFATFSLARGGMYVMVFEYQAQGHPLALNYGYCQSSQQLPPLLSPI